MRNKRILIPYFIPISHTRSTHTPHLLPQQNHPISHTLQLTTPQIHHPSPTLTCTSCSTPLGTSTPSGYKLHKWTLTLTTTSLTTTTPSPPLQHFLLPHLHAQSSALGLAKFTI